MLKTRPTCLQPPRCITLHSRFPTTQRLKQQASHDTFYWFYEKDLEWSRIWTFRKSWKDLGGHTCFDVLLFDFSVASQHSPIKVDLLALEPLQFMNSGKQFLFPNPILGFRIVVFWLFSFLFLWCDHCFCSTSQRVDSDGRRHFDDLGHWDATSHGWNAERDGLLSLGSDDFTEVFLINFYKIRIFSQNFYIRFDAKNSRIEASETCFNVANQCKSSLLRCSFIGQVGILKLSQPVDGSKSTWRVWQFKSWISAGSELRPPRRSQHLFLQDVPWFRSSYGGKYASECYHFGCFGVKLQRASWKKTQKHLPVRLRQCLAQVVPGLKETHSLQSTRIMQKKSLYFIVLFRNISFHLQAVSSRGASSNDAHRRKYRWPQSVAGEMCEMALVIYSSKECRNLHSTSATARIHAETSKSQTVHDSCINFTRKFGRKVNSKVEELATLWEPQGIVTIVVLWSLNHFWKPQDLLVISASNKMLITVDALHLCSIRFCKV